MAILDYGDQRFYTNSGNPRCLLTANLAVRREVFERIGTFSPAFERCQDHELLIRLWRAGERALYAPDVIVRASISGERLTKRYHREWHARRGGYAALMRLQEIIDASGRLVEPSEHAIRFFGTPGFVYRELATETRRWLWALLRLDPGRPRTATNCSISSPMCGAWLLDNDVRRSNPSSSRLRLCRRTCGRGRPASACHRPACCWQPVSSLPSPAARCTTWRLIANTGPRIPMFSTVEREPTLESMRLFGVTRELPAREIPLLDGKLIQPFDQCRLSTAFARTYRNQTRSTLIAPMLRDTLDRYERLRSAGEHNGPPLRAVRLYELRWNLEQNGGNVTEPDRRQLLAEVRMPGDSGGH